MMCLADQSTFLTDSRSLKLFRRMQAPSVLRRETRKNNNDLKSASSSKQKWAFQAKKWENSKPRWYQAASRRRWLCTIIPCILIIITGGALLALALNTIQRNLGERSDFVHLGFGVVSQYATGGLNNPDSPAQIYLDILFANLWQFIISILYVQSNFLLSCIFANREWYHYAAERKALRVSTPTGLQRSSYHVSMPWRFGIPLISTVAFLHWTLSQSVFVLPIESVSSDGTVVHSTENFVGFSILPIVVSLIIGISITTMIILAGTPHYPGGIPIGATCSAVLSAACHQPPDDKEAYRFPVQWGAVSHSSYKLDELSETDNKYDLETKGDTTKEFTEMKQAVEAKVIPENEPGHCCFTTARDVEKPRSGELYQ